MRSSHADALPITQMPRMCSLSHVALAFLRRHYLTVDTTRSDSPLGRDGVSGEDCLALPTQTAEYQTTRDSRH